MKGFQDLPTHQKAPGVRLGMNGQQETAFGAGFRAPKAERAEATAVRPWSASQIWQRSMALVKDIYQVTNQFPDEEKYGLAIQIRRAAISDTFKHRGRTYSSNNERV